jgi:hypothetical protein
MKGEKLRRKTLSCIIVLCLLFGTVMIGHSRSIVDMDMVIDKQTYNVGDTVRMGGNVTLDGVPVADALVAIEIRDPYNDPDAPYIIRTVKTGENYSEYEKVQIIDLYTCDSQGNPKDLFSKGSLAYISITIKNVHALSHHVEAGLYIQYSDNTPFKAFYPLKIDIGPDEEMQNIVSVQIPSGAPSGEARIFANLFTGSPVSGGTAYCLERTASFYIGSTTPTAPPLPQYFNITFTLPRTNVKLGRYMIYARSYYALSLATEIMPFDVILLGDIYKDGRIDMRDVGLLCNLYGLEEGDPDWNPDADVYKDGIINMRDIGVECANYYKTGIY